MTRSLRYAGALLAISLMAGGGYAVAGTLITSKDIADGSIKCKDLRSSVCERIKDGKGKGKPGPRGPQGPAGPQGPGRAAGPGGSAGSAGSQGGSRACRTRVGWPISGRDRPR